MSVWMQLKRWKPAQNNRAQRRRQNDRQTHGFGGGPLWVRVCIRMTKLILCAKMLKCLGFGWHVATDHRLLQCHISIQNLPPSCITWSQSHHNPTRAFCRQLLTPNISRHDMYSQLDHLKRLFNSAITLQPFSERKHVLKTVITLQSFRPKRMEISSDLCHLEQLTTGHFINSQWRHQLRSTNPHRFHHLNT